MENKLFYNEILTEHNMFPENKREIEGANLVLEGVNPSCGDDIIVSLKVDDNNVITDGAFTGSGCAISQASADIMLSMLIGRDKDEALHLADLFFKMIKGEASEDEIDELEEAGALRDISHMPARVKCALLGWRTVREMFGVQA
ncbi:MAG: SUF system NifU family Fe-S cluster assembly protein [Lachnospiraceae bacterium]|uniref:Fe-S cluster assembly sulfur transfer protein SufU n=1 Tax=Falcatimonas sp. MSJ-15 TaxID=2841515 RepID=UPI001C10DC8A|nr:SUF system NifU family Fe-S cluster assembly protein [Falcatimonas sp. MSJ-15]MBQ5734384.1 SUF system NifU family Fe-S cluster assembly protein [Lachnospiraceae bacterium]MBU5470249.1 SUF system NifU family Fe-S cluster assembly protein [Falcatimonas sp. MSJ-15]MEE0958501.1 SUF system NifU family Fe-S cluster assembly protein [Lachnospiraceae bacterium]